jgi:hypothetical protein
LNISNIVWGGWRNIKLTTKSDFKDLNSFKVNT